MGDNKSCKNIRKDDVLLSLKGGDTWLLKDVCQTPKLNRDGICISQLHTQGCHIFYNHETWKVTKGSMVVVKGNQIGNLYILEYRGEVGVSMTIIDNNLDL